MNLNRSKSIGLILVTAISLAFVFYFYADVLSNPNKFLFSDKGDAAKNYFTYAAHVKEPGIINSTMMNYPYGENFLYLDCHPLFTMIIKLIAVPFPTIVNYTVGIVNFLMIFSYVISALLIYLILQRLKVSNWFAVVGALSVSVLNPQIYRIYGHLALSYSFMIPLTWYLFIRFTQSKSPLKWSILLLINNLAWYLVHGYMGMISVSFTVICFLSHIIIFDRNHIKKGSSWLYFTLQGITPLLLFWAFITFSDIHTGRNKTPYGILDYCADFSSVFIPHREPFSVYFKDYAVTAHNWEGWSYIGIAASLMILVFLLNNLLKIFRIRIINDKPFLKSPIFIPALISSIVLLLLSMGYPFNLKLEFLLDYVKVINNFRAIGRFAWAFYYVITVWAVYYAFLFYESRKKLKFIWIPVILLIPALFIYEALPYHREASGQITKTTNFLTPRWLPSSFDAGIKAIEPNNYQAIIPLPYYLIGSEDYKKAAPDKIYQLSMAFGYHTGLPIAGNYSTNTSIIESKNLYQLLAPTFYRKEIEKDIKSDKPFLVIFSKDELNPDEKSLLNRSKLVFDHADYSLYSISKEMLFVDSSNYYLQSFKVIQNDLVPKAGFLVRNSDRDKYLQYYSYDSLNGNMVKSGKASLQAEIKNYTKLAEVKPGQLKTDQSYIISFWIYNDGPDNGQKALDGMAIIEYKDASGQVQWPVTQPPAKSVNIDGKWTLVEMELTVTDSRNEYSLLFKGNDNSKLNLYVDDLMIRAKGYNVYKIISKDNTGVTELFYNNHRIHKR